jgi:predicted nucleic acid-binding Zn ribbon protein
MNCPNCGTYNPDDRTVCWRCDKELPKPKPQKKRSAQQNAQVWLYVIVAVFLVLTLMQTCGVRLPFGGQGPAQPPEGRLAPASPSALLVRDQAPTAMVDLAAS